MKYFEDFPPGTLIDCGSRMVSKEEIIRFAREFDPQPFHIDEAAAAKTHFGGVVASGWHSGSLAMRYAVESTTSGDADLSDELVLTIKSGVTACTDAPRSRKRLASSSVWAQTALNAP